MNSEKYISDLAEQYKDDLTWIDRLRTNYEWTIDTGLAMKFKDAQRQVNASVSLADVILLYVLVRTFKPDIALEVGTWFGTSAFGMAMAMRENGKGIIYTCDKNNCYLRNNPYADIIKYYNCSSGKLIRRLMLDGENVGLVFVDGRLSKNDVKNIAGLYGKNRFIYTNHDYGLAKCDSNLNYLRKYIGNQHKVMLPLWNTGKSIMMDYKEQCRRTETRLPLTTESNTVIIL